MKTVGIIGGLGPETTAEFYLKIIEISRLRSQKSRPPILMWSVPLEYRIEKDFIEKAESSEKYLPYLQNAAKRLENGGADFIVIPCNSVHIFIDEIRDSVDIPVLSIVEETVNFLKKEKINKVGLLSTYVTTKHNLYTKQLSDNNIENFQINKSEQKKIGEIINRLVLGDENKADRDDLLSMISNFKKRDISCVLLACTDLQLIVPQTKDVRVLDTMEILVQSAVETILS